MDKKAGVRWGRVIFAGLLTEVCVVLLIILIVTAYRYAASPAEAEYQTFAKRIGYIVGVVGGAWLAFLFAWRVARPLSRDFILNGFLVGCVAVLLHVALFLASGAEFQFAYVIADALKLAGGALGGYAAQRNYQRFAAAPAAHRSL